MSMYPPVRDEMVQKLSTPRLNTYTAERGGDIAEGLDLYRWNLDTSMVFFESIHYFEVALRNTIDGAMTRWMNREYVARGGGKAPHWLSTSDDQLLGMEPIRFSGVSGRSIKIVLQAEKMARKRHADVQPGHIVSQLTLGFWTFHLRGAGHGSLWAKAVKSSLPSSTRHAELSSGCDKVVDLRNRIAHHEPIFNMDLAGEYENLIHTSTLLSEYLGWWIDSSSRVDSVLRAHPFA